ncbi:MAG: C40 family peptidase [Gammaproteobacteria bacterium]
MSVDYRRTSLGLLTVLLASLCLALASCVTQPARSGLTNTISENTPEGNIRLNILRTAQRMLGTPYQYGGATPRGFDCSGLVFYSYKMAGINVPRTSRAQYQQTQAVPPEKLLPGDLLFFSIGGDISHVGIYQGGNIFIHAPVRGKQVSRDSMTSRYWSTHFVRGGRLL